MTSQVNEGIWTQDVQKEDAKENTWTYERGKRGTERTDWRGAS